MVLSTGVVVTAAGPHSGDDDVLRRWGDLAVAAQVHVRAAIAFTALAAVLVAWVVREGAVDRLTARLMWVALPLVAIQIGIGEYQYRNGLPWQAVVFHVTVAALVWAVIAGAAYGVARPAGAAYGRRDATRWQETQRTASGSAQAVDRRIAPQRTRPVVLNFTVASSTVRCEPSTTTVAWESAIRRNKNCHARACPGHPCGA